MRFIMSGWEEKIFNQEQALPKLGCILFVWNISLSTSGFETEDLIQQGMAQPSEVIGELIFLKTMEFFFFF